MNYDVILFDADDTLFDYKKAEDFALTSVFGEFGVQSPDTDFAALYRTINQELWNDFEKGAISLAELRVERFSRLFNGTGLAIGAEEFSNRYLGYLGAGAYLIDGAVELVEELRSKVRLAIITNGIREVQLSRFSKAGVDRYFEHIIVSEDTGFQKPHIGIFDYAFKKLGITDPSRVLIVGDSLTSDIQGGLNSGMDTCWYNPHNKTNTTPVKPKFEIKQLSEVLTLL
ncbi:2-haloacid dehalogenase [Paenibacillus sp. BK033]|uniref:YjjG family noncanonical pyrimidine nucleotidase n=1 Tax=Paenibacillus sp. BK033 TaxID=2512133 RepID=UPI00104FF067|nr:YjjG family noncanonical pyrimidine nucleotidase [Paenibacillus sp. BK033]TCM99470.1 2-haloacid dehalogenase [Paenibacillus sp. BK033]